MGPGRGGSVLQKASPGTLLHQEGRKQMGVKWSGAKGHTGPNLSAYMWGEKFRDMQTFEIMMLMIIVIIKIMRLIRCRATQSAFGYLFIYFLHKSSENLIRHAATAKASCPFLSNGSVFCSRTPEEKKHQQPCGQVKYPWARKYTVVVSVYTFECVNNDISTSEVGLKKLSMLISCHHHSVSSHCESYYFWIWITFLLLLPSCTN